MASVKTPKVDPVHLDIMGKPIEVQHTVITHVRNSLKVGVVTKITPKNVRVKFHNEGHHYDYTTHAWKTDTKGYWRETIRVPKDVIVLDSPEMIMYILQHS